jgi:hypothetical protein
MKIKELNNFSGLKKRCFGQEEGRPLKKTSNDLASLPGRVAGRRSLMQATQKSDRKSWAVFINILFSFSMTIWAK